MVFSLRNKRKSHENRKKVQLRQRKKHSNQHKPHQVMWNLFVVQIVINRLHERLIWSVTWPFTAMSVRMPAKIAISAFDARIIWKNTKANIWKLNRTNATSVKGRSAVLNCYVVTFHIGIQILQLLLNVLFVNLYVKRCANWNDIENHMIHRSLHVKRAINRSKRNHNWTNIRNHIMMSRKPTCAPYAECDSFVTIILWFICDGTQAKNVRKMRRLNIKRYGFSASFIKNLKSMKVYGKIFTLSPPPKKRKKIGK